MSPVPERHLLVIFGATGDLSHRKLIPALWELHKHSPARGRTVILGLARADLTDDAFRDQVREALKNEGPEHAAEISRWCRDSIYFQSTGDGSAAAFERLKARIGAIEHAEGLYGNRAFYLALPLPAFAPTVEALGHVGLHRSKGWTRLVLEKPFGHDLGSAQALNALIHRFFDEGQVFRLDHYLGKETVQNLIAFRFGNALFEPLWNRDRIERVELTVAEELGVEGRGAFYEQAGATRDLLQNHMLQVLAVATMEPPAALDGESVSNEKIKILKAITPIRPEDYVVGQYGAGELNGKKLKGYREEPGVDPNSVTDTFVAVRFGIQSWRWQGVPFYLRTGKRLPKKLSRIIVTFKSPPAAVFNPYIVCGMGGNRLEIVLQPNEGFNLSFQVKLPGDGMRLHTQEMRFRYAEAFGHLPEAYQTLLLDVMHGDHTLFVRGDEVEQAWKVCAPMLDGHRELHTYAAGTWGPPRAEQMLAEAGCCWTDPS
ncbi:MAG: glucose-6-phosphate dehydrogenase [Phycisphaerales bacterium]|nr:glucose-6-phosphate dehydrogenase [Phycisphaerales bacterium]